MAVLFILVLLASFILFIVGLVSPNQSLFWYKKERTKRKSVIIYGLLFFISIVMISISMDNESVDNENTTKEEISSNNKIELTQAQKDSIAQAEKQEMIEKRKDQTISASNLVAAYDANEVNADDNFKGKKFYVIGYIDDIGKDILDDIYVTLQAGDSFRTVQCYIDDKDEVKQLRKGQLITVIGECNGLMINVLMKNCKLVENL